MKNLSYLPEIMILLGLVSCRQDALPPIPPDIITETTAYDTDDPAVWVNPEDPSKSIVFGTDKASDGAIYAFDLKGKVIEEKTIRGIQRPNNVDVAYGLKVNDSTQTDILAFTEREKQQIRLFSLPDMKALDGGGFPVFQDEVKPENRQPMGIALYKSHRDGTMYAIVSRKTGPKENYLYQYAFTAHGSGVQAELVRKFGSFSGEKEIEAIAVDDELGFVYYSDEGFCIRKYPAEPSEGGQELDCFGGEYFLGDMEGIAIVKKGNKDGYIIISDQQRHQFNVFSRKDNSFIKAVNLTTHETDGCEAVSVPLNGQFPNGLFVSMNEERNFYYHDLDRLLEP